MLHLSRDRQNLGQFSPEEVAEGLRSNRFLPTDLAWREGMDTWQPLSTFTDLPAVEEATAPILAPGSPLPEIEARPAGLSPAWERNEGGLFTRAYESVREILGNPRQTFASMPIAGGLRNPLTFLLLVETICALVSMVYSTLFEVLRPRAAHEELSLQVTLVIYAALAIFLPLIIAIGSFISAGILHVCLMIVGAKPKSFEATYRVICYANGATSVFLLIPICGSLVQAIWNLYAIVAGFREVHGTTTGKATIAVILPMLLCCGLVAVVFASAAAIPAVSQMAK